MTHISVKNWEGFVQ